MKFSSQEEYGLRCLIQIGRRDTDGGITIPQISQEEGLTIPNVAKLTRLLRLGGFVESVRGQDGGYKLARPAGRILIAEVLDTLGGRLYTPDFCDKHAGMEEICAHTVAGCSVRFLWETVQTAVDRVLDGLTLEDLLVNRRPAHHAVQIPVLGTP
jgi:Rrf2 family protein